MVQELSQQNTVLSKQNASLLQQVEFQAQAMKKLFNKVFPNMSNESLITETSHARSCDSDETSSTRTESSIVKTVPQFDKCNQSSTDEGLGIEMSSSQSGSCTKASKKSRRRHRKSKGLSIVPQTIEAIRNVASLAGWSEAKLEHELRVYRSRFERKSTSSCSKFSMKRGVRSRKIGVKEGITHATQPPFPPPLNVPPPPIPTRVHKPGKVQTWNSQDKIRTQHFYRNLRPLQNCFENSTPVEFWGRKF